MPTASSNVRVGGQSGKHVLVLSSSQFDPERTFLDLYQSRTAAFHKLLAVSQCEGGLKAPFMKPQHDEPASVPEKPSKPSRTEEARRIVEEYADDLTEILKKFRKLFN